MIINKFETLSGGIEKLESDLNLIQTYADSTIGCGMESLDAPSDKLAERYFATAYPDHYKLGSGQEGIKDLIEKIKSGIKGLKNILKSGKADPLLKSTTKAVSDEVKKTYGSDAWIEKQTFKFGKVSVPELGKLVAGDDLDSVKTATESQIKLFEDTLKAQLKIVCDFWTKVEDSAEAVVNESDDMTSDAFKKAIDAFMKAAGTENPAACDEISIPEYPVSKESSFQALTKETVKDVAELITSLMEACVNLERLAEDARIDFGGGQELFIEPGEGLTKEQSKRLYGVYWDVLHEGPSTRANKMAEHLFNLARALEQWILASLK
ncbi:hypothetical protein [Proteus mirabilis]|uniref:hypothetical protein n=1 Tax=Proteus mirabilis TaxID=584 RepID=UPI0034D69021